MRAFIGSSIFLYGLPSLACPQCHRCSQTSASWHFRSQFCIEPLLNRISLCSIFSKRCPNVFWVARATGRALAELAITPSTQRMNRYEQTPLLTASTLLGIGMGGFLDGILFHRILQVHSILSNRVPRTSQANVEIDMFWDGLLHAFSYVTVIAGLWLLWKATAEKEPLSMVGSILWNVAGMGIVQPRGRHSHHEIFQVHHVIQYGNHLLWDMVFVASGVVLIEIGWGMVKSQSATTRPTHPRALCVHFKVTHYRQSTPFWFVPPQTVASQ